MQSEADKGIDPILDEPWKYYMAWVKKNSFTVLAIIIILSLVLYDINTVQVRIKEVENSCNIYWHEKIDRACPGLAIANYRHPDNLTLSKP